MNANPQYAHPNHHGYVDGHPHPQTHHLNQTPSSTAPPYPYQVPLLPPTMSSYATQHPQSYYGYPTPTTPHTSNYQQQHHQPMTLSALNPAPASTPGAHPQYEQQRVKDTTGQVQPPNTKPKITATLWEDEATLCFQVEVDGICVARRSDNTYINGTKLLNVAKMTRGRRDGILKSEKLREVIKIGPMHLKGVWIPYDRALEFANKEGITEALFPLFVHGIETYLSQPQIPQNTAALSRRGEPRDMYPRTSMTQTPGQLGAPHSILNHSSRPNIDRAHTFPTPPTSASTVGMSSSGSSYEWGGHNLQAHQPVDSGLSTAKSMPTTPATTPPEGLQHMHYTPAPYDRPVYTGLPAHQSTYSNPPVALAQYGYGKTDMAPPVRGTHGGEHMSPKDEVDPADRSSYTYQAHADQPQTSPVVEGFRGSPNPSRATPRTMGYSTPQRANTNGYPAPSPQTPQSYYYSGQPPSRKRERDIDDEPYSRPMSQNGESDLKRRKTVREGSAGPRQIANPGLNRSRSMLQR